MIEIRDNADGTKPAEIPFVVRLDRDAHGWLIGEARRRGMSAAALLRSLLADERERRARVTSIDDARAALAQ